MSKLVSSVGVVLVAAIIMASFASANTAIIRPNGTGYYSEWNYSGCSLPKWQCVDENPANATDRLFTKLGYSYEYFQFQDLNLSANTSINNLSIYYYASWINGSRNRFMPILRLNSTDFYGGTKRTTANYTYYTQVFASSPYTEMPWTVGEINSMQAGMSTQSDYPGLSQGSNIAQVYIRIDYN